MLTQTAKPIAVLVVEGCGIIWLQIHSLMITLSASSVGAFIRMFVFLGSI